VVDLDLIWCTHVESAKIISFSAQKILAQKGARKIYKQLLWQHLGVGTGALQQSTICY